MQLGGVHWASGGTAVEVFFVVSGFYMQMVLSEKYTPERLGGGWWKNFFMARYFRLFPVYFACLLLTVLAAMFAIQVKHKPFAPVSTWIALTGLEPSYQNILLGVYVVFANLTMFLQELVSVLSIEDGRAALVLDRSQSSIFVWDALSLPHGWSLGVELLFYAFAPFLLNLRNKWLVTAFVLGLLAKLAATNFLPGDLHIRLLPFVLMNFLAGALCYRFRHCLNYSAWLSYGALIAIIFIIPAMFDATLATWISIALAALAIPVAFRATRNFAYDSYIGELSYPFYVFHLLSLAITSFALQSLSINTKGTIFAIVSLSLTLGVSIMIFFLESKFLEPWRKRFAVPIRISKA